MARAELGHAARRLRGGQDDDRGFELSSAHFTEAARPRPGRVEPPPGPPDHIARYYANLELPVGASVGEVKAAYRRLMRRYHPDRHLDDPERAAAAHRLAHELRVAYEGLLVHLAAAERVP